MDTIALFFTFYRITLYLLIVALIFGREGVTLDDLLR